MGLFEKLFPKKTAEAAVYTYFKTLGGYAPVYTSFEGGVYEMALTRACITGYQRNRYPALFRIKMLAGFLTGWAGG